MGRVLKTLATLALLATVGVAQAGSVFQGRLADGTASSTCSVSGANKCAMFYDSNLDITILNDWGLGRGVWSATAAPGSAQALAETAGTAQTDFSGWFLPTGDRRGGIGALNQYLSIWNDVGRTVAGLVAQFDGLQYDGYWSSSEDYPYYGFAFNPGDGFQPQSNKENAFYAVAVRPGDVASSVATAVPEPQTLALAFLALGATVAARKRQLS